MFYRYDKTFENGWTSEEDDLIKTLHQSGFKWKEIVEKLEGRTLAAARSRWSLVLKYDVRKNEKKQLLLIEKNE